MSDNVTGSTTGGGGSANEIKIGEGILGYVTQLGDIIEKVRAAYAYAESCAENMGSEGTYEGGAHDEMAAFFNSLESNMQKLIMFYSAATSYIQSTYRDMYYNDQQLADWMAKQIDGGNT